MSQKKKPGTYEPSARDWIIPDRKKIYYKEMSAIYGPTLSLAQIAEYMGRSVDYACRAMRGVPRIGGTSSIRAMDVASRLVEREIAAMMKKNAAKKRARA